MMVSVRVHRAQHGVALLCGEHLTHVGGEMLLKAILGGKPGCTPCAARRAAEGDRIRRHDIGHRVVGRAHKVDVRKLSVMFWTFVVGAMDMLPFGT